MEVLNIPDIALLIVLLKVNRELSSTFRKREGAREKKGNEGGNLRLAIHGSRDPHFPAATPARMRSLYMH